jgi:hypothetical protein
MNRVVRSVEFRGPEQPPNRRGVVPKGKYAGRGTVFDVATRHNGVDRHCNVLKGVVNPTLSEDGASGFE